MRPGNLYLKPPGQPNVHWLGGLSDNPLCCPQRTQEGARLLKAHICGGYNCPGLPGSCLLYSPGHPCQGEANKGAPVTPGSPHSDRKALPEGPCATQPSPVWQQWFHRWSCSSPSPGRTARSSSSSVGPPTAASTAEGRSPRALSLSLVGPEPSVALCGFLLPAAPVASCCGGSRPAPGSGACLSGPGRQRSCPR